MATCLSVSFGAVSASLTFLLSAASEVSAVLRAPQMDSLSVNELWREIGRRPGAAQ